MIDTGFIGYLTVSPSLAMQPGLGFRGRSRATRADGSGAAFEVYDVAILDDAMPWSASPGSHFSTRNSNWVRVMVGAVAGIPAEGSLPARATWR